MVASLLKILSSGVQDKRLYYEKTVYPFLKKWSRAGRFATRWERLDFANVPNFGITGNLFVRPRGELISRICLVATLPDIYKKQKEAMHNASGSFAGPRFGWTNSVGHALVSSASISIGGNIIDTLDYRLLEMVDEYNTILEKVSVVNRLIKRKDAGFTETSFGNDVDPTVVMVPIPFWFSRGDFTMPLTIDAMRNDEVVISINFNTMDNLYYTDSRNTQIDISDGSTSKLWTVSGSPFYKDDVGGSVVDGLVLNKIDQSQNVVAVPGINMPTTFSLGDTYMMVEYIYLDKPEASRFRNTDLQIPIIQHYVLPPAESLTLPGLSIPIHIKNPVRELFWFVQRKDATLYNAHFLATKDINAPNENPPWWPDAMGLDPRHPGFMRGAFALSNSDPVEGVALVYEGKYVRFRTGTPALFRTILPSLEQKKTPWVNRYYYKFSFILNNNETPLSVPRAEANFGKIKNIRLDLEFKTNRGSRSIIDLPNFIVYVFAESYNILKIYDGRAVLMFNY